MPDFISFIKELSASPMLIAAVLPAAALMLVNGWTDAPVAIATAVGSGAIKLRAAVILAAVCNLAGAAVMIAAGSPVAVSVYGISGLGDLNGGAAGPALTGAMLAVVIWSLVSLFFGVPTSESHALLAALTGAAAAPGGFGYFDRGEWIKVLYGLLLSTVPVMLAARGLSAIINRRLGTGSGREAAFGKLQIAGAALSSFAHGAQDGQKFAGVMTLAAAVCLNARDAQTRVPVWTAVFSAAVISLGMLIGGKRIIKSFDGFASKKSSDGAAADLTAAAALVIMSCFGIPASTTHAKTSAVFGVSRTGRQNKRGPALKMAAFWLLTFPFCAVLGYLLSKILFAAA